MAISRRDVLSPTRKPMLANEPAEAFSGDGRFLWNFVFLGRLMTISEISERRQALKMRLASVHEAHLPVPICHDMTSFLSPGYLLPSLRLASRPRSTGRATRAEALKLPSSCTTFSPHSTTGKRKTGYLKKLDL